MYGSTSHNNNNNNNYNNNYNYNSNINTNMYNNNASNPPNDNTSTLTSYEFKYKMEESIKELRKMKLLLEQLTLHIATKNDNYTFRDRLKSERAKALSLFNSLSPLLQTSRPEFEKLKQDITKLVVEIGEVIKRSKEKEESFPLSSSGDLNYHNPGMDLRSANEAKQLQMLMTEDLNLEEITEHQIDNKIIKERNEAMAHIHDDLQNLLPLTESLAGIVGDTTELLHKAEKETARTSKATHENLKNIELGGKRQTAARKKCLVIWGLIIFCILAVLAIIGARIGIAAAMA